ncbi:hypothetical protein D9M68_958670 [compost metagenome]
MLELWLRVSVLLDRLTLPAPERPPMVSLFESDNVVPELSATVALSANAEPFCSASVPAVTETAPL